jgi:hypothetical protein
LLDAAYGELELGAGLGFGFELAAEGEVVVGGELAGDDRS